MAAEVAESPLQEPRRSESRVASRIATVHPMARQAWLDQTTQQLLDELATHGLTADPIPAAGLVVERVEVAVPSAALPRAARLLEQAAAALRTLSTFQEGVDLELAARLPGMFEEHASRLRRLATPQHLRSAYYPRPPARSSGASLVGG